MKKRFYFVTNMSRSDARQVKFNSHTLNVNLVTVHNPISKITNCRQKKLSCII